MKENKKHVLMAHMTRLASYGPFFVVADHLTIVVVFVVVVVVVVVVADPR
jgi:hypothetical protein